MNDLDRKIINLLQDGLAITEEPYADAAKELEITESKLLDRLGFLLDENILTRFGPMYDAAKLGGDFSLVAIKVPDDRFDEVADIVNGFDEVAHNYHRDHELNMWYVLATEKEEQVHAVNRKIERLTGLKVFNMPKLDEYYIGLKLTA